MIGDRPWIILAATELGALDENGKECKKHRINMVLQIILVNVAVADHGRLILSK